jgi:HPr kinase/phosphorylase
MMHLHASCVAVGGVGILLRGPSGAGKSDLALRLIDGGARLIADDRVELVVAGGRLVATAPRALAGLLEVRGIGILPVAALAQAEIGCVVDLVGAHEVERLPEPMAATLAGVAVPRLALWAFAASAPAQIRLAAQVIAAGAPWVPAWPLEVAAS